MLMYKQNLSDEKQISLMKSSVVKTAASEGERRRNFGINKVFRINLCSRIIFITKLCFDGSARKFFCYIEDSYYLLVLALTDVACGWSITLDVQHPNNLLYKHILSS